MKVPLYDGEPVDHNDHNLQRELIFRKIFDELAMNLAGPTQVPWDIVTTSNRDEELRPLRHAGAFRENTTTSIDINGGLWIHTDFAGPLTADAAISLVGHKDAIEEITGFAAASAGNFRRDIIQARLTPVNDAAVARDFEDAVTRNVTTTSSQVRRIRAVVEYQRKAGVEQATQPLADTPANEQTPDVGWFKIGSVLCNDTGLMVETNYWDWRKPWGSSRGLVSARDFYSDAGNLTLVNSGEYAQGQPANLVLADCPLSKVMVGAAGHSWSPVRMHRVVLLADFVSAPLSTDVRITQWNLLDGFVAHWGDVGAVVGTIKGSWTLMNDAIGPKPLWASGGTNPYAFPPEDLARLTINTAGTTDHLYGVNWEGWGGF